MKHLYFISGTATAIIGPPTNSSRSRFDYKVLIEVEEKTKDAIMAALKETVRSPLPATVEAIGISNIVVL